VAIRSGVRENGRMSDELPDARVLASLLGDAPSSSTAAVADHLHVNADVAERCLAALERDGLVERADGGEWRLPELDPSELRELYPAVAILETLALRQAPPFDASTLAALRAANADLRAAVGDPPAAIAADYDFHDHLTRGCGNQGLLAVLGSIKRALVPFERAYMLDGERVERSAAQHDEIIAALEAGDHNRASDLVRENFTSSLPDLTSQFEEDTTP
jgi:DNA-binding GntR family transcriptional regulator